jgi:hypothetical protein
MYVCAIKIFTDFELDLALKGYGKDTLGIDRWPASGLMALPKQAKQAIAKSVETSINTIAIPHQNLVSLNALLCKPNGDCRTITKTPMLYRMALRADKSVSNWEKQNNQKYDKAGVGSSALLAALARNVSAEVAYWLNEDSASVFNDFHKFFDTIDVSTLLKEAALTEFPRDQLSYAMMQHMAPRVLQVDGYSSGAMVIYRSILAGCKYSVAFTRVYLKRAFCEIVRKHQHANTEVFVDDTSMHNAGDESDIYDILIPAMISFKDKVDALKLTLSPKATITASKLKSSYSHQEGISEGGDRLFCFEGFKGFGRFPYSCY